MTAGVVIYRTGEESLKKLGGLARKMPITAAAFTIAALSIAGFPGFNGFVSKGIVIAGSHYDFQHGPLYAGGRTTLEWLLLLGGVGTFMSFIKFGYYAFFHGSYDGEVQDANRGQTVAMLTVAALCVGYGVFDGALFAILPFDVTTETVVSHVYVTYTVDHLVEGVALAVAGLIGFALTKKPLSKLGRVPDIDAIYNRVMFYGGRGLVVGVTELWAGVDRAVMRTVGTAKQIGTDPQSTVQRLGFGTAEQPVQLRLGIGRSAFVLVALVSLALVVLLVA